MLDDFVLELHNVPVMIQEREDVWVVRMPNFALTAYGATEGEAEAKSKEGLRFLLQEYETEEELRRYLDWSGVAYRLVPRRSPAHGFGSHWVERREPVMSFELTHV